MDSKLPANKKPALGRGLGSLLGQGSEALRRNSESRAEGAAAIAGATNVVPLSAPLKGLERRLGVSPKSNQIFQVPIEELKPNPEQPRKYFDSQALDELAQSIREYGILEPLLVQSGPGGFVILAGERRWRAAQRAGLKTVPAMVHADLRATATEIGLVENLQREDLNALEAGQAYQQLIDDHGYTQEALAQKIGKDRSTIANALRLLRLPQSIQDAFLKGQLTEGHCRSLLALEGEVLESTAREVLARKLNVRDTERLTRQRKAAAGPVAVKTQGAEDPGLKRVRTLLEELLMTRVQVKPRGTRGGTLTIEYHSNDELDRLIRIFKGE